MAEASRDKLIAQNDYFDFRRARKNEAQAFSLAKVFLDIIIQYCFVPETVFNTKLDPE